MIHCEVKINGVVYTEDKLLELGKAVGQASGKMHLSDMELAMAIAVMPLVCGFAASHKEASLATLANMELEQFKRFKQHREDGI